MPFFEKTFTSYRVCCFIDSPEGRWLARMRGGAERVSRGRCLIDGFWGSRGLGRRARGRGLRMRGERSLMGPAQRKGGHLFLSEGRRELVQALDC